MSQLLVGTTNKGKIIEIREALHGLPVSVSTPTDFGITNAPVEHGDTFQANALEKARFYFERTNMATLADDSGIIVEALVDELGIHTRRWGAGSTATDEEWIGFFLDRMKNETNKRAHFVCVLCYIDEEGHENFFEGRTSGVITEGLEANYLPGLPISACFKPDGHGAVYSAMNLEQKNSTSHRGKAMLSLRSFLEKRPTDRHV